MDEKGKNLSEGGGGDRKDRRWVNVEIRSTGGEMGGSGSVVTAGGRKGSPIAREKKGNVHKRDK